MLNAEVRKVGMGVFRLCFFVFLCVLFPGFLFVSSSNAQILREQKSNSCERMITLSPSVTDLAVALDLESQIVGVSSFDATIIERRDVAAVGNLFQVNIEAILSLKPDLIVILDEQQRALKQLKGSGIEVLVLDHRTIHSIRESVQLLGSRCSKDEQARAVLSELKSQEITILKRVEGREKPSPRVLIVIGDGGAGEQVRKLFVSGKDGFYYQLLELLRIKPIYDLNTKGVSALSLEALIDLKPTHILHVLPPGSKPLSKAAIEAIWGDFPMLPAVQNRQIYSRAERFFSIPGIEYPKVLEAFYDMFLKPSPKESM